MRHRTLGFILGGLLLCLGLPQAHSVVGITIAGTAWSATVNSSNTSTSAGWPTLTSGVSQQTLSTTGSGSSARTISVKRTDSTWNASFTLNVQRTGNGTGVVPVGGTSYIAIGTTNVAFFTFSGNNITNVPIQYQLTGMTGTVVANTYLTTITFTVA